MLVKRGLFCKKEVELKSLNHSRKALFINTVANLLDVSLGDFRKGVKEITSEKLSDRRLVKLYDRIFFINVKDCFWQFLTDEDKRFFVNKKRLKLSKQNISDFINRINLLIKAYNDKIKEYEESNKEDIEKIVSFVAFKTGWTADYIKELDELTLLKVIENLVIFDKQRKIEEVNYNALAVSCGKGNKRAIEQLKGMNRALEVKKEVDFNKIKQKLALWQKRKLSSKVER